MALVRVTDPATGEVVQEWDDTDYKCRAQRGLEPMNEACGGCVGCLEIQAIHYGFKVERPESSD